MDRSRSDDSAASDLQALIEEPRESLDVELKDWLDLTSDNYGKATIAKEILALANHGGGWLLVGVKELQNGWTPSGECPHDLRGYSADAINSIVGKYADPKFEVQTHLITDRVGNPHVVIVVPGGHRVPVRARAGGPDGHSLRKNTYYTRLPGPQSAPIEDAAGWDAVIARCMRAQKDTLAEMFREIARTMAGTDAIMESLNLRSPDQPSELAELEAFARERLAQLIVPLDGPLEQSRFRHGTYSAGYDLGGVAEQPSLSALLRVLREVQGRDTGWPMWLIPGSPEISSIDDRLECFLSNDAVFADAAHSDLWIAKPSGRGMLLRGYQDDSEGKGGRVPGTLMDITIPIWRAGELALHTHRLSQRIGTPSKIVQLRMSWTGLRGRELSTWASPNRFIGPGHKCLDDTVTSTFTVAGETIPDTLPEIAQGLVSPLFAAFDFEPDPAIYAGEIGNLRRRA